MKQAQRVYGTKHDSPATGPQPGHTYRELTGGPLNGRTVELHPMQDQNGEYGVLFGKDIGPGNPAYARDEGGRWIWQGKPFPTN